MEDRLVKPELIFSTVNAPKPEKVERIAASMRAHGWSDERPVLVEEGSGGLLYAWTGSNRVEAAKLVGLPRIPCRVITRVESQAALDRLPDPVGFSALRVALTASSNGGGRLDQDRLAAVRALGLDDIAAELNREIASKES